MKKLIFGIIALFVIVISLIVVLLMSSSENVVENVESEIQQNTESLRNRIFNYIDSNGQQSVILVDYNLIGYIPNAMIEPESKAYSINGKEYKLFDRGLWISKVQLSEGDVKPDDFSEYQPINEDVLNYPYFKGDTFVGYTLGVDPYGQYKIATIIGDVEKLEEKLKVDEAIDAYNKEVERYNSALPQQGGEVVE